MNRGSDNIMGADEHRAIARRCRMLANGINDRSVVEALLALAEEHEAKAAQQPPPDEPQIPAD